MHSIWIYTLAVAARGASGAVQLAWTTDYPFNLEFGLDGTFGPDGPWQAVFSTVGNDSRNVGSVGLWPSWGGLSTVPTRGADGEWNYLATNSSTAVMTGVRIGMGGDSDSGERDMLHDNSTGDIVFDIITPSDRRRVASLAEFNTTLDARDNWTLPLLGRSEGYPAQVGTLGLGAASGGVGPFRPDQLPLSALEQYKKRGLAASMSYSLHMGSAAFNQSGSLVIGGYEQNRALGRMGVFSFDPLLSAFPVAFLIDVQLGTQVGASAFARPEHEGSVWRGVGDDKDYKLTMTDRLGVKADVAIVMVNAAVPYIYLPMGTCEEAASRLPVVWNKTLGLYLWNTTNDGYRTIVSSPAYMAFVFSDQTATNITIKVPFALLNLTLTPPLTTSPTPYFPCKPSPFTGYYVWLLGRAFLQAAFFGYNLEHNVSYLAQAPGPHAGQSVAQALQPTDRSPKTNDIREFETSWAPTWTVIPEIPPNSGTKGGFPNTAELAGLVSGGVLFVAIAVAALWWFCRKNKRPEEEKATEGVQGLPSPPETAQNEMESQNQVVEMETKATCTIHEAETQHQAVEMAEQLHVHEVGEVPDGDRGTEMAEHHELPAENSQ
ncbi:hypothetical protein QBC34DRAFT_418225 [Podospora aff. communis PSN243]|uniref:Peptidase A1 domain-containing protein n=1 Tax=Podospora aff. communis PSN243 TaxID=3040156 RepID=A0AAV9G3Z3_9PEZI|nr:hypothetical protein QBC34DRAFT_418225 [Podospora aff. communis PSN243]